jgi:hypothetical protein
MEQQQILTRERLDMIAIVGLILDVAILSYLLYSAAKTILGAFMKILGWFIVIALKIILFAGSIYGLYYLSQVYMSEAAQMYIRSLFANITAKLETQ